MGNEVGRRPVLGALVGAVLAVMLDGARGFAGAATTPPGGAIPEEALRRIADAYGGSYTAKWIDSTGKKGTGSGKLTIDPSSRRATGTGAIGGKILGRTALGRRTISVDLVKYGYDQETATLSDSPWGPVSWQRVSGGAQVTLRQVPGLASGTVVDLIGRFPKPGFATFTYTITPKKGTAVRGAVNIGRAGAPFADPVVPSGTVASAADLATGAYACGLITKAEATAAFAEPSKAPERNGGRIGFGPGIDTSNCRVESASGNQLLQMTVYHGHSADDAARQFELNRAIATPVPGLESRAYSFLNGRTVWLLGGNDVVELNVIDERSSDLPPALAAFVTTLATKTG